ncbi:class I SAM-dependent methyltransferase [Streptomyces sp. ACA25]|uniref:SAM-dependent methyltransferase n=1 Tax=Streptomyces sp. ACA25 TaxID=3022596 RepID=UPI0023080254|nr:class I SAM-dependent methyltransferase [Streptomyces sp. ACA25]MDB1087073.1 class I SAM-dependent methyltransferase [Streptomyces sp. ACA25]
MDSYSRQLITHADHPIAAPLSEDSVRNLLDRVVTGQAESILDLGCGEAAWLLRAMAAEPELRAVGVDLSEENLTRAEEEADRHGARERLELLRMDAREYRSEQPFDVVLSIGATHAFGGLLPTLAAARSHLAPGGTLLLGDCFWEREPDPAVLDVLGVGGDEWTGLADTVDRIIADGWVPVHGHTSTLEEWDEYEWSWTGSLSRWALEHPEHPDSAEAAELAAEHRSQWLRSTRGTVGFVTVALRPAPPAVR